MEVEESDVAEDDLEEETEASKVSATDNVGDPSVELNVDELISELEAEAILGYSDCAFGTRRRLDELMEIRRAKQDFEDFDDYDI